MTYDLTIERLIEAAPEAVFDAFVDPDAEKVLYDNEEETDWTVESELDLRVGGTWTIVFGKVGDEPFHETNVFTEVDRPRRLAFASTMFKGKYGESVTLDGVMQAPGRPDEDRRGGFEHGGWAQPYNDEVMGREMGKGMGRTELLLGRRTYENLYAFWPTAPQPEPVHGGAEQHAEIRRVDDPGRAAPVVNSSLLRGDAGEAVAKLKAGLPYATSCLCSTKPAVAMRATT